MPHLDFKIGNDGDDIGIAATFAVAVHTALYMRCAFFHCGEGIGNCHVGIVVRMDADHTAEALTNIRDNFAQTMGQRSAIGVAQADHVGTGKLGSFQSS